MKILAGCVQGQDLHDDDNCNKNWRSSLRFQSCMAKITWFFLATQRDVCGIINKKGMYEYKKLYNTSGGYLIGDHT